tara:strand:+ start:590 stop:1027 length:438 start_codon:yes stop_codon:yes gene_type:complete
MEEANDKIGMLSDKITRLEAKVDLLIQITASQSGKVETKATIGRSLERLTTKQHAALQMLFAGCSNADIAERFEVSQNTAKVYVRGIANKIGVNTRNQIVLKCFDDYKEIEEDEYRLLSGGLPKHWAETFEVPDPYKALYAIKQR